MRLYSEDWIFLAHLSALLTLVLGALAPQEPLLTISTIITWLFIATDIAAVTALRQSISTLSKSYPPVRLFLVGLLRLVAAASVGLQGNTVSALFLISSSAYLYTYVLYSLPKKHS